MVQNGSALRVLPRVGVLLLAFQVSSLSPQAQARDGGVDPWHLGKGDWVYQVDRAVAGCNGQVPAVTNVASLMAHLKAQGLQFVIVKAGDGSTRFPSAAAPQFTSDLVDAAHAAGLRIFGYNRSYGTNIPGEIAIADYVFRQNADGFIFDAEAEWEADQLPENTNAAVRLCSAVRTNWPNKFLAHAPFPLISLHTSFPYKEFGYYCDAVMPQDYWNEIGPYVGSSPAVMAGRMSAEYRDWQKSLSGKWTNAIKPIVPVGQGWSSRHPLPAYQTTAAQITDFFHALNSDASPATKGGYQGISFWVCELHPLEVWDAIRTNTIGNVPANAPVPAACPAGATSESAPGSAERRPCPP